MKYDTTDPEFQTWLKGLLHDSNVKNLRVTFTKTDGSLREMLCTLVEDKIPLDKIPKTSDRTTATTSQRVFDIEKQEWRSFKWESITHVSFDI